MKRLRSGSRLRLRWAAAMFVVVLAAALHVIRREPAPPIERAQGAAPRVVPEAAAQAAKRAQPSRSRTAQLAPSLPQPQPAEPEVAVPPAPEPPATLTPEERLLLERHTLQGLERALAEADNAVALARPAEQDEAYRQYLLLANLVAKLAPRPPPPPAELLAAQQAYLNALPAEEARLARLPEGQRTERLMQFKQSFFPDDTARQAPEEDEHAQP
jgi:hypothetical protein